MKSEGTILAQEDRNSKQIGSNDECMIIFALPVISNVIL